MSDNIKNEPLYDKVGDCYICRITGKECERPNRYRKAYRRFIQYLIETNDPRTFLTGPVNMCAITGDHYGQTFLPCLIYEVEKEIAEYEKNLPPEYLEQKRRVEQYRKDVIQRIKQGKKI